VSLYTSLIMYNITYRKTYTMYLKTKKECELSPFQHSEIWWKPNNGSVGIVISNWFIKKKLNNYYFCNYYINNFCVTIILYQLNIITYLHDLSNIAISVIIMYNIHRFIKYSKRETQKWKKKSRDFLNCTIFQLMTWSRYTPTISLQHIINQFFLTFSNLHLKMYNILINNKFKKDYFIYLV